MKQVRKAVVAIFLLLALAIQSVPLVGAAGPLPSAGYTDTEALQSADADTAGENEISAEERYVEDLSTVDWDKVIDNRICLRENKDLVPDDYEWTVEDFPELELEDVFDNDYSIYLLLQDSGKESLTYAIEKMALREEFCEVSLCHVVEVDPITDEAVQSTTEAIEEMIEEVTATITASSGRAVPNDPGYSMQSSYLEEIGAPEAWWYTTGSSTLKIGVIDTGINDVDLGANLGVGKDFYSNSTDPTITDDDIIGHGTRVAQTIGALGNNSVGIAGLCWNIELIPLQALISDADEGDEDYGRLCSNAIRDAFLYAEEQHIPILNCSLGSIEEYGLGTPNYIRDYSGLIVAAAGNDGIELHYGTNSDPGVHCTPACYEEDNIISVGALNEACNAPATNTDWNLSSGGSNYGEDCVDIFAPGTNICFYTPEGYIRRNGTSHAAPMVTGAAALLWLCYPYLSPVQIKYALMDGGTPLDNLEGKCVSEKMLNIIGAINLLQDHANLRVEQTVSPGTYVIGAQQNAFQVLSIDGGSTAVGAELETYEANGSDEQKFNIQYHSDDNGYYTIQNVKSGLYLETANSSSFFQSRIRQNVKTENENQKWVIIEYPINFFDEGTPTYYIMNKEAFFVMDCKTWSIANNNPVQLYTWHSDYATNTTNRNQGFVFFREADNPELEEGALFRIGSNTNDTSTFLTNVENNAELQGSGTELRIASSSSGYKIVDNETGKVLTLENGSTAADADLVFATDTNALYQQWQIKHNGDGTVRFISAATGSCMDCYSGLFTAGTNIWTYTPNGTAAQRFRIEPITDRVDESLEYEVTMLRNTSNVAVLCASAAGPAAVPYTNGNVLYPFTFEYVEDVGLYVIRDKASQQVLTMSSSGGLSFSNYTGADTQYWILKKAGTAKTTYTLQSADTRRYLKWSESAGQWSVSSDSAFVAGNGTYWFYLNVRPFADGQYIIRPQNAPGKAFEAGAQAVSNRYALQFQDYTGEAAQVFYATFDTSKGAYSFASIEHPTYYINTLSGSTELDLLRENVNKDYHYWTLYPQSDGFCTVLECYTGDRWWTLQQGTQKIFVGEYTGSTLQQFAFVPVADEIAPGFYHIAPADDDSQALGTSEDGSISLQASASAQIFVPVRAYSSYMLVDYESGNALYLDEDGSIHQEAIDSTDPAQLWQIKFELDENGDPTENILISAYLTMDCMTVSSSQNGAIGMQPADGSDEQSFVLDSVNPGKYNVMGDIVLSADADYDAAPQMEADGSVSEGAPLERSAWGAEGNRRRTFKLLYDSNGFCKIRDAQSTLVLEEVDNDGASVVVLNQYSSASKAQKWIVLTHTDGTHTYINADTGHCITLSGLQASAESFADTAAQKYRFIEKWDINQDGVIGTEDLIIMRWYLVGSTTLTPEQAYAADADDDGISTMADLNFLTQVVAGNVQVTDEDANTAAAAALHLSSLDNINYEWLMTCSDEEFLTYLLGENYASYSIPYAEIIK